MLDCLLQCSIGHFDKLSLYILKHLCHEWCLLTLQNDTSKLPKLSPTNKRPSLQRLLDTVLHLREFTEAAKWSQTTHISCSSCYGEHPIISTAVKKMLCPKTAVFSGKKSSSELNDFHFSGLKRSSSSRIFFSNSLPTPASYLDLWCRMISGWYQVLCPHKGMHKLEKTTYTPEI